ncbi:DUF2268 domain-containing protein [Liquorilactobacillus hordei]|uniref:DUF2268 domain-containing protein n=1 Tax=Liquorilactobacillus hordei TaxID=468911 RepID=UPI001CC0D76D|nr:DUF2268 domain-containing putative Zn-dependent protease [Liquorilactobacillus hordei]MBZ2405004.1 Zn-dependent protease [Liquorilactobacillus hordei]
MIIKIPSESAYKKLADLPVTKRRAYFSDHVLQPFTPKFKVQQLLTDDNWTSVYKMLATTCYLPEEIDKTQEAKINFMNDQKMFEDAQQAIQEELDSFAQKNIKIPVADYKYTIFLGKETSAMLKLSEGYLGDGGIPGFLSMTLISDEKLKTKVGPLFAHECNHNIRYQFTNWTPQVELCEWIIAEGLAESYVAEKYGESMIGPWISKTDNSTVEQVLKPMFKDRMHIQGMNEIMPYIYGDQIGKMMGYPAKGLPYAAGYSLGYHLVQYYLVCTGKTIEEATILPAAEILKGATAFWE